MSEVSLPDASGGRRDFFRSGRLFLSSGWFVAAVAALTCVFKLIIALTTYGTNDVYSYEQFSTWSSYLGVSLYHVDPLFNHPPSMIHVLHGLSRLSAWTGLPFSFWLRVPAILADMANVWLVWKLLGERVRQPAVFWAVVLLAAAPPLILISGFHGNTDSVVMCFVLLCVYLVEKDASAWASGAVLALAHCVKVYPLIAAPAILLSVRGWSNKIKFCAAGAAVILLAWAPYFYQDPRVVIGNVFGYRSAYGMWGFSYILDNLAAIFPRLMPLNAAYAASGAYLALGLVVLVSWRMHRAPTPPRLFSQIGLVFLLFLFVSSGFGVQYLAWLAPWVVEQGALAAAMFYSTSGIFLFLVYNLWSQGFPWYLANSYDLGTFVGYCDYSQLLCWISLLMVLGLAWKRVQLTAGWKPLPAIPEGWRWAMGAAAAVCLFAIVPPQLPAPQPTGAKYEDTVRSINARSYLDLAVVLSDGHRYQDSIQAARQAVALRPDLAREADEIIGNDRDALGGGQP